MSKEDSKLTGQMTRSEPFQQHEKYSWINENKLKKQWSGEVAEYQYRTYKWSLHTVISLAWEKYP